MDFNNAIEQLRAGTAELKASNDAAARKEKLRAALAAIDEMWNNSIQSKVAGSVPTVCFDRANDRIGLTSRVNGKLVTKF